MAPVFFPTDAVNIYGVERDQLYLVGESEVPAAAFHAGEFLAELPLRYVAYSTCFRRRGRRRGQGHSPACSACTSSTRWRRSCAACRRPQPTSTKAARD